MAADELRLGGDVCLSRDKVADQQFINNNYKPKGEGQEKFRILLHGPIGAGKSSFINSTISALEGKISHLAPANTSPTSFTKEYKTYSIKKGNHLVINDMMGLSCGNRRHRSVHERDVLSAMKGHIKDGYIFNPESSLLETNSFYKKNPTINEKAHVLVTVIDANKLHLLGDSVVETIQEIRDKATDLGIPHVAVLTKIDEVCPEIKKDVKNVCRSRNVQEKVHKFSKLVGNAENCYHMERNLDNDTDALVLNTLRRIIETGDEKLSSKIRTY